MRSTQHHIISNNEPPSIFELIRPPPIFSALKRTHVQIRQNLASTAPKLLDKLSFVFGVTAMWTCAFVIARFPERITDWYGVLALGLLSLRVFSYRRLNWHYFLFDLCYYVNFLLLLWLFVLPQSQVLYHAVFCLSNGPIAMAILAWRNSMVFHSLDKMTSLFIHLAPPLVLYTLRWHVGSNAGAQSPTTTLPLSSGEHVVNAHLTHGTHPLSGDHKMTFLTSMVYSLSLYLVWQAFYFLGIMVMKRSKVEQGERVTSYSWLLDADRNKHHPGLMYRLCTVPSWGVGQYQLYLYVCWQFLYAFVSITPTVFLYRYFWLHTGFLLFLVYLSIWNGATYYIDVVLRSSDASDFGISGQSSTKIDSNE